MQVFLLRAVRSTIRADSDPIRQELFEALCRRSRPVRLVRGLHAGLGSSRAAAAFVALYGAKSWLSLQGTDRQQPDLVSLAVHANARRRLAYVARVYGADRIESWEATSRAMLSGRRLAAIFSLPRARRLLRLLRRLARRHGFLVQARVASTVACYARSRELLKAQRPKGVLVSSDSNPEELGLVGAAHANGLASIFVSHAYTTSVSPPLDFSLAVLEGEAALDAYRRKGPVRARIFLAGLEDDSLPMQPWKIGAAGPSIGILAPKVVDPRTLSEIIEDCAHAFGATRILIRWHPSMLGKVDMAALSHRRPEIVETDPAATLAEVVAQCDWVVTDAASNASIEILKNGVPAVPVAGIGTIAETDIYGFVARGVVYPPVRRLAALDRGSVESFYGGDWPERFRVFDASYLRPSRDMELELAASMRSALAEGAGSGAVQ